MADMGIWGGLNQASQNAMGMGMNLLHLNQQQAHQQALEKEAAARTQMMQESAQISNAEGRLKLEEMQKAQAAKTKIVDITTHPMFLSLPDEVKPGTLKYFAENGYTDATGKGTAESVMQGAAAIEKSKPLFQSFMEPVIKAKQGEVMGAWNELREVQATGDEKKIKIALAKFENLNGQYHQSLGKFDEHIKTLTDQENKMAIEMAKKAETARIADEANKTRLKAAEIAAGKGEKPSRVPFRDTETGKIFYYDKNNPEDRKQLETFGHRLVPVAENPVDALVMQSTMGKGGKATYKTADDVKAAFKAGLIPQDEATKILKDKFGFK